MVKQRGGWGKVRGRKMGSTLGGGGEGGENEEGGEGRGEEEERGGREGGEAEKGRLSSGG